MVVGGSIAVLVFGLTTAWLQSLPIHGSLQGGAMNWILVSLASRAVAYSVPPGRPRKRSVAEPPSFSSNFRLMSLARLPA